MDIGDKLVFLGLTIVWLYITLHFGFGQARIKSPVWEHYILEGYFLLSLLIVTWLVVVQIKIRYK